MQALVTALVLSLMTLFPPASRAAAPVSVVTEVTAMLTASAELWSAGDLDGFLAGYEDGPATRFVRADRVIAGADAIREMYRSTYGPASGKAMGALRLVELEVKPAGRNYALAIGRFALTRPATDGGAATGLFTLLLHRGKAGWKIQVDHTP